MSRHPVTETLGALEPSFAAVHREHLKDERATCRSTGSCPISA